MLQLRNIIRSSEEPTIHKLESSNKNSQSTNNYTLTTNYTDDNLIDGTIDSAEFGVLASHNNNLGYIG